MKQFYLCFLCAFLLFFSSSHAQTLAFPGAEGFGRFAAGARAVAAPDVYVVTNLNDAGAGSFRDAVSVSGRVVVFAVGGIVRLASDVSVKPNITIAGQTAPGSGIVFFNKRVTFTSASNTICRYIRIRLGATGNSGNDATGLASGANMIFDHLSVTWGMDENFSLNNDGKGTPIDNITIQNSIIGQGLFRENHSAGGLVQTPDGGRVSLLKNLYMSNKTRNPKVKGVNEFVNNVVYNYGNGGRLDQDFTYPWAGDAYIMGGTSGISEVNVINNYFVGGPLTPASKTTPFSRGTGTFNIYGAGNYFDNNRNGVLDGAEVPFDSIGYPGITGDAFKTVPFAYPSATPLLTAAQSYQYIIDNVGSNYPRRDQVDTLMINEVISKGTRGMYVYRETDLPLANGGLGDVYNAPAPLDTDADGMPDAWEDAQGLNKNSKADAVTKTLDPAYLNIEVYINSLTSVAPPAFVLPPSNVTLSATSTETPAPSSTVVINWNDASNNEDNFILERSANGTSFTDIAHPAANATTYTDNTGLLPNTTYYYRIKAVVGSDASVYSAVVSLTTPAIPSAPTKAIISFPTSGAQYVEAPAGKLTLKWTGSTNTLSYAVYFGTDPANLTKLGDKPYVAAPFFDVTGVTDNTTYYWRIDASNDKGIATGTVWSFRTVKSFAPGLVGYWSFDETGDDTHAIDSSAYENHGVLGLEADDQSIRIAGKRNNALDFATARTDMYVVSVPHQDQLFLDKGAFSLSFWMKAPASLLPQDNNTSAYLLCKGSITKNAATGATGKRFDIEFKNKEFRFAIDDDDHTKDELTTSGVPFFTGDWVHVVAMRDTAAKQLRLYLNGSLLTTKTVSTTTSGIGEASALVIGNIGEFEFIQNPTTHTYTNSPAPYKGQLDELKIYNYAVTPEEVLELYNPGPYPLQAYAPSIANNTALEGYDKVPLSWKGGSKTTGYKLYFGTDNTALAFVADIPLNNPSYLLNNLTAKTNYYWRVDAVGPAGTTTGNTWMFRAVTPKGLVGYWKLNEQSGAVVTDNGIYANNGTVTSGMLTAGNAPWNAAGKWGGGMMFNNSSATNAISIPHNETLMFDQNAFTISMWVKLTSGSSNYNSASPAKDCYLIQKGQFTDPGGKWYGIQLRDSALVFGIDDAVAKSTLTVSIKKASGNFIFNDAWTNIVAVRDTAAKLLRMYINAKAVGTVDYSPTTKTPIGKELPILIGNSLENKPYHDMMDDIQLYNYALSASDITALQTSGVPAVLPLKLLQFTATKTTNAVSLSWQTAEEVSTKDFEIQRSNDGTTWQTVGVVAAKGQNANRYAFEDVMPLNGGNYYRLKMSDIDGQSTYSPVRQVLFEKETPFTIAPNPANNKTVLSFEVAGEDAIIEVTDMNGRLLQTVSFSSNATTYTLSTANFTTGTYLIRLRSQKGSSVQKLIVSH